MNAASTAARFQVADASDLTAIRKSRGRAAQSLLAPLFPAEPPSPRNARIVTFDDEQLAHPPEPTQARAMSPQARQGLSRRERAARRAARRSSLFSAAGF